MDESSWKTDIYNQLQSRNKLQTECFQDLVLSHNKLFENSDSLRNENLQLSFQIEKLRRESLSGNTTLNSNETRLNERIQQLEQKLLTQQEELTELHRRKGENAQQIIDLTAKLQEKEKLLILKDGSIAEQLSTITMLRAETRMYESSIRELQNINQTLRDEHQALQLAYSVLEEKIRSLQEENQHVVEQFMHYKTRDADKMNEENDNFVRKKYAKMQRDLEDAVNDVRVSALDDFRDTSKPIYKSTLPTKSLLKYEAHDGEVNAVTWAPDDQHVVATGGSDRKVQLWSISKGSYKNIGTLVGSNAAVMSVAFDHSGTLILGTSNDFASRIWGLSDSRLKHTLTGHSGKVMAGKFLGDQSKVVTGSYDRTLKIWDLRSRSCIETKFAGSSCNDLVTVNGSAATIISGHYDKRIRFWDSRASDSNVHDILLNGKITSVDLSRDTKYLVSCVRDDTLKLIDLRMNQIMSSFSCDGFKVSCDWSRVTFSPDGQYVAVGSSDSGVYIWAVNNSAKVESVLKDNGSAILATAWNPYGTHLITVDRAKRAVVWGDE